MIKKLICCFRCACVEPSDPTNGTVKFWEVNNITASEIYWEALEVKVWITTNLQIINPSSKSKQNFRSHQWLQQEKKPIRQTFCSTKQLGKKRIFGLFILKWHAYPDGWDETRLRTCGLDYIRLKGTKIIRKAHFWSENFFYANVFIGIKAHVSCMFADVTITLPCFFLTCRIALKREGSLWGLLVVLMDPMFQMCSSGVSFSSFLLLSCLPFSRSSSSAITSPQRYCDSL